ncbi:exodeoxyribonuclease V subunit alpha [Spongorhabdus nitratireducens]
MLNQLATLARQNQLRPIDYQFARFIHSLDPDPVLTLCSALVSYELGRGNVCLPLAPESQKNLFGLASEQSSVLLDMAGTVQWEAHLESRPPVGSSTEKGKPFILDQGHLYLNRYWRYEKKVADIINQPAEAPDDLDSIRKTLDRLFARNYEFIFSKLAGVATDQWQPFLVNSLDIEQPDPVDWSQVEKICSKAKKGTDLEALEKLIPHQYCLNWQKVAAAVAASRPFSVISGGPGTGKTTTVTRLLALLVETGINRQKCPDIRLVAPTGKAAARLTESIGQARSQLNCDDSIKQAIPAQASTIHRLLGVLPGKPGFRHNRDNQLHLDILVVDEASMIDLPLMARLLDALPDKARLILLGDRDQLASVEAGSVLGDICGFADEGYSQGQTAQLEQLTGFNLQQYSKSSGAPVRDSLCLLRKSYRFDARSGIGQLARAVNQGQTRLCNSDAVSTYEDVRIHSLSSDNYQKLLKLAVNGYQAYLEAITKGVKEREILKAFNGFRLLCALREGPFGVDGLNQAVLKSLRKAQLLPSDAGQDSNWYIGRPVMITRNDHGAGLYNGDIGITLPDDEGRLRVIFEMPDGQIRSFLPSRLPEHNTVFAMTVHKSQGSEFNHTVMILPDKMNPVLTRELVYTGITRAREQLDIYTREEVMAQAVRQKTQRFSGLPHKIRAMET